MTDAGAGDDAGRLPYDLTEVEADIAHPARIADYLKGGDANFDVDRQTVEYLTGTLPKGSDSARDVAQISRQFRIKVIHYLAAEAGMRQFLNIESHLPSDEATHQIAQKVAPDTRVFYVITEAVVLAHAHTFTTGTPEGRTAYTASRDHDPRRILREAAGTLDLDQPVAIILAGVSQRLRDEDPFEVVAGLLAGVPSGSYLVASHLGRDIWVEELAEAAQRMEQLVREKKMRPIVRRSHAEVAALFDGLELVGPGVVPVDRWCPEATELASPPFADAATPVYGGVGRKP